MIRIDYFNVKIKNFKIIDQFKVINLLVEIDHLNVNINHF